MSSSFMPRVRPLLLVLLVLLVPVSAARADTCQAPPGSAAIDEYCENIPTPSGTGGHTGSGGGGATSNGIPGRTARQLSKHGAAALLALPSARSDRTKHAAKSTSPSRDQSSADSGSPLDAIGASISHGDTAGGGLVWVLLAIALVLGAAAWLRFRRRPPTPD